LAAKPQKRSIHFDVEKRKAAQTIQDLPVYCLDGIVAYQFLLYTSVFHEFLPKDNIVAATILNG
jgi:hypothetical protein